MDALHPQTSEADLSAELEAYLQAVHDGERRAAIAVALAALDSGVTPERVITDLLARAQEAIGLGWQQGLWCVALEHRASSITESALHAVADAAMRSPGAVPEGSRGRAVVACTEGEWHVLPGRMASEVLRLRGADVSFFGPSVPATELADALGPSAPAAVAITCSMQMSLAGSWRTISALRTLGMTIVCGGRGFGPHGRWGLALGADLWAPDFASGSDLLMAALTQARPAPREPIGSVAVIEELRIATRDHQAIVESSTATALAAWPYLREVDAAVRATREDLDSALRVISAATITGDPAILEDFAQWFESVLAARDLPVAYCSSAFALLLESLPEDLPLMRAMAQRGLDACTVAPLPR